MYRLEGAFYPAHSKIILELKPSPLPEDMHIKHIQLFNKHKKCCLPTIWIVLVVVKFIKISLQGFMNQISIEWQNFNSTKKNVWMVI